MLLQLLFALFFYSVAVAFDVWQAHKNWLLPDWRVSGWGLTVNQIVFWPAAVGFVLAALSVTVSAVVELRQRPRRQIAIPVTQRPTLEASGRIAGIGVTESDPPDWGPGVAQSDGIGVVFTTQGGVRHFFESWDRFSGITSDGKHVTLWLAEPYMATVELEIDHDAADRWVATATGSGVPERMDPRFQKLFGKE